MIIFNVFKKNLISALRGEYTDFFISRLTFILFTVATAFILFRLNSGSVSSSFIRDSGISDYRGFIIIGSALYGTTQGILLNVSRTLMTERREGTLECILIIPFKRQQYYIGNQLHQLSLSIIDFMIASVISAFAGIGYNVNICTVLLGLLQILFTLHGLALITSILMITFRDTFIIQNTLLPLMLLSGGYLFTVESLPPPLLLFSRLIPVNYGVKLVRTGLFTAYSMGSFSEYLINLLPAIILITAGYLLLPLVERTALENYLS